MSTMYVNIYQVRLFEIISTEYLSKNKYFRELRRITRFKEIQIIVFVCYITRDSWHATSRRDFQNKLVSEKGLDTKNKMNTLHQ